MKDDCGRRLTIRGPFLALDRPFAAGPHLDRDRVITDVIKSLARRRGRLAGGQPEAEPGGNIDRCGWPRWWNWERGERG